MKNFDDFLSTLDEKTVAKIIEKVQNKCTYLFVQKGVSYDNQIWALSFTTSIELIRLYHEWLNKDN